MTIRNRHDELIAVVLDEAKPSPRMQRCLETAEGRREWESYRRLLGLLDEQYGDIGLKRTRAVAYYAPVRTPLGRLLVAATDAGLVRIAFDASEAGFEADLRRRLKVTVVKSPAHIAPIARQLEAYFAGQRRAFDVPLDLSRATPFQRRVLAAARAVPAGHTASYTDIARRVGRPGASRAVGQALGHNPVPIVIPCHRIVRADGGLGGYIGGLPAKRTLLRLEGASAVSPQRVPHRTR